MPIYSAEEYNEKHGHLAKKYPLPDDCESSNYPRVVHGEETFRFLQNTFLEHTYAKRSYHHRTHARNKNLWYSGIDDHYVEARDEGDERGRGLYAVRDIPRGTRVWYNTLAWVVNNGYWASKESLTTYLERLPHDLQCDVILWAYAEPPKAGSGEQYIECNLDEASFLNHAERPELINIGGPLNRATRYIYKGEELLMDYSNFIAMGEDSVPWWDEIRNLAWKKNEAEDIASYNEDVVAISESNNSGSCSSSPGDEEGEESECIDDYVKFGVPKTATAKTAFVDALSIHGSPTTNYSFSSMLAGIGLAWILTRCFVATGVRRRR